MSEHTSGTTPGIHVQHVGTVESVSVSATGADRLKPNAIGLMGVIFVAVTGAAPISAMLFNVPISVGYGNGIGTPAGFLVAAIVLTIFSVSYVAMAKHIRAAGGFYSFISHGLGRDLGLITGICGGIAYSLFEVSLLGGFAYFANGNFNDWFGWDIPWPIFAFAAAIVISVFCWFDVELSVRVLGVALIGEVIILALFDILVIGQGGGSSGLAWSSLNPAKAFDNAAGVGGDGKALVGAAGVGIFFAFWSWVGFEAAPNYAEESKDPVRNVPRATLFSVIGLGVLYVITSFAFVSAFPRKDLIAEAQTGGPAFFSAMQQFGTHGLATIMQVLILTGSFACAMAFHNIAMRYFYAMGREGVLPRALGKTHGVHRSPYYASVVQTVLAVLVVAAWGIDEGFDNPTAAAYVGVYGMMAVQGVVYILAIQALCALAIIIYFWKHKDLNSNPLVVIVCPIIAILAQVYALYLLFKNIHAIAGTISYADQIWWIAIVGVVVAAAYAFYIKANDREKYDLIGRVIDEGIA